MDRVATKKGKAETMKIPVQSDPDEVAKLVVRLADFLFPDAGEGDLVPLGRAMTILQALAVSMGSVIHTYAFTDVVDSEGGRKGVVLNKEKLIDHLLDLARETMRHQADVEQH